MSDNYKSAVDFAMERANRNGPRNKLNALHRASQKPTTTAKDNKGTFRYYEMMNGEEEEYFKELTSAPTGEMMVIGGENHPCQINAQIRFKDANKLDSVYLVWIHREGMMFAGFLYDTTAGEKRLSFY